MTPKEYRKFIMDNIEDEHVARTLLTEHQLMQDRVTEREDKLQDRLTAITEQSPEKVERQIRSTIQNVSEATTGEYVDDYCCKRMAEHLYFEGYRKV